MHPFGQLTVLEAEFTLDTEGDWLDVQCILRAGNLGCPYILFFSLLFNFSSPVIKMNSIPMFYRIIDIFLYVLITSTPQNVRRGAINIEALHTGKWQYGWQWNHWCTEPLFIQQNWCLCSSNSASTYLQAKLLLKELEWEWTILIWMFLVYYSSTEKSNLNILSKQE